MKLEKQSDCLHHKRAFRFLRALVVAATLFCAVSGFVQSSDADSIVQITAEVQGLEQVSSDAWTPVGTYWEAMPGAATFAPLPGPLFDPTFPVYAIADGQYLVDGSAGQLPSGDTVAAMAVVSNAVVNLINQVQGAEIAHGMRAMGMDVPGPPGFGDGGGDYEYTNSQNFYTYNTNLLWLQITNVSVSLETAYVNLYNATDQVYAIWSTTDLTIPFSLWQVETEVFPTTSTTNRLPFTVPTLGRQDLFLRAQDWTGVFANGLPDWWTWYYFHTLNLSWTNSDGNGDILGDDYTNVADPNVINFIIAVTNTDVNTSFPNLPLDIISGVPAYVAVLVNDGNQADATWYPYTGPNALAVLGADGDYSVSVGLRGFPTNATETWEAVGLTKNTVPPRLTITSPTNGTVVQIPIQFQGYASKALSTLTYDLNNANGTVSGQPAFLTGQFYDTNLMAFTTNYWQSDDIYLAGGTNIITIHASDWAGNQTNATLALNYPAGTSAPVVSFLSPSAGTVISGNTFTLQAQVNNPAVTVSATSGSTTIQGVVERNGMVWVQNLPLAPGTNAVSITASDANGHMTTTNLNVVDNDLGLEIDPLDNDELNQPSVDVFGFIAHPNLSLVVNGVQAVTNIDGTWEADDVPVSPTGTAVIGVQVFSNAVNVASKFLDQVQPVMVALMSYSGHQYPIGPFAGYSDTINWFYKTGGTVIDNDGNSDSLAAATNGTGYLPLVTSGDFFTSLPWEFAALSVYITNELATYQSRTQTRVMVMAGGQEQVGTTNLYLVMARACEVSNTNIQDSLPGFGLGYDYYSGGYGNNINRELPYGGDVGLPPEWLQVNGKTLANTGITNVESAPSGPSILSVWGATIVAGLAGQNLEITATATNVYHNWDYTFLEQSSNLTVKIFAITNGTVIDLSSNVPEFCVGQQVVFSNSFDPPLPAGIPVSYQWNLQGEYVNQITNLDMLGESPLYTNNPSLTTNSVTALWWCNGGTNLRVNCTCTVGGGNGIVQGHVNIYRPTLSGFTNQSPRSFIMYTNDDDVRILSYGDKDSGSNSMNWSATINSEYDGRKGITQIITADYWVDPFPGHSDYYGWADASEFYDAPDVYSVTNLESQTLKFGDIPSINIGTYSGELLFTNTTDYIRFKPGASSNDGNIFVTLGIVRWNAHGRYNNLTSTMTDNYTPPASTPDDADEFPIWLGVKEEQQN